MGDAEGVVRRRDDGRWIQRNDVACVGVGYYYWVMMSVCAGSKRCGRDDEGEMANRRFHRGGRAAM